MLRELVLLVWGLWKGQGAVGWHGESKELCRAGEMGRAGQRDTWQRQSSGRAAPKGTEGKDDAAEMPAAAEGLDIKELCRQLSMPGAGGRMDAAHTARRGRAAPSACRVRFLKGYLYPVFLLTLETVQSY